jgi:arylsulfatase
VDAGNLTWQASRMEVYAAQVTQLDTEVGRLLSTLDETGTRENTLVLFLSDNGACAERPALAGQAGLDTADGQPMVPGNIPGVFPGPSNTYQSYGMEWANVSNSPFRKYKRWVEEGGISSPGIASWPAQLAAGGMDHSFLHFIDVMPTLLELAEAPYPEEFGGQPILPMEGESFAAVLTSPVGSASLVRQRTCFWEHMGHRAARHGRWKVVSDRPTGGFELFDMVTDRTEMRNVAASYPEITDELSAEWNDWKLRTQVRTWSDRREYRPA